jgi:redox-sensitive bicupin YhaK (pirin superfamily)
MDGKNPDSALEVVIVPRSRDLGDNFEVRRALPATRRRMVGPFVFLDQMGPHSFPAGSGLDVRPHPHIGLATVTYLFEGEILHRDSLGTRQPILPGEVNWMTAGRGIVHSERTAPEIRQRKSLLSGLQCWVALPRACEEIEPSFVHAGAQELPVAEGEGISAVIIAGEIFGRKSPVPTLSDLFYVDVRLEPDARVVVPARSGERAIYVAGGSVDLGRDGVFESGQLLVLKPGKDVTVSAPGSMARMMLLGGEPMDGPRAVVWNFVSSSLERIEQAKEDWRKQVFPPVPDESEFIPLPDLPGRPVFYP